MTGLLSPNAAFAELTLPVVASGYVVATLSGATVRLAGFRTASLKVSSVSRADVVVSCRSKLLFVTLRVLQVLSSARS